LTITKAVPILTLEADPSWTEKYNTVVNISCASQDVSPQLFRNDVNVGSENNVFVNLTVGVHNYKCNITETENYTANEVTNTLTISKADNPVSLYINNFLNQNVSILYNESFNVMGISAGGAANLFRNGQPVPNPEFGEKLLAVGVYEYKVNATGNENYTDNITSLTYYLTINKTPTEIIAMINSIRGDALVQVNSNVSFDVMLINLSGKTVTLYTNLTGWTNHSGPSPLNNITNVTEEGYFIVMGSFAGDENYTGSVDSHFMNVTGNVTSITLYNISHSNVTDTTALITWNTLELADSAVLYEYVGQGTVDIKLDFTLGLFHGMLLENLLPNKTYFYVVRSCDSTGLNCNVSTDLTFTTTNTSICIEDWNCSAWSQVTCGTRTCNDMNNCGTVINKPSETATCPPSGNTGTDTTDTDNKTESNLTRASRILDLRPGKVLITSTDLQYSSENILEIPIDTDQINKLVDVSRKIVDDFYAIKHLTSNDKQATIVLTLDYRGDKKLTNFMIYDTMVKEFAPQAAKITVSAPGARFEIVNDVIEYEYLFVYDELKPGDQIIISYATNNSVNASVLDGGITEVYAESLEFAVICNKNNVCEFGIGENLITCPDDCDLANVCQAGELRCLGYELQTCEEGVAWIILETCPWGCFDKQCQAREGSSLLLIIVIILIALVILYNVYEFRLKKKKKVEKKTKLSKILEKTKILNTLTLIKSKFIKKRKYAYENLSRKEKEKLLEKRLEERIKKAYEKKRIASKKHVKRKAKHKTKSYKGKSRGRKHKRRKKGH